MDQKLDVRIVILSAVMTSGLLFAQSTLEGVLLAVCDDVMGLIPPIAFLLVATAAVAYALGGVMSAEMRARTHVWAQSLLIGAIIGGILYIVVPRLLGALISAGLDPTTCQQVRRELCNGTYSGVCRDVICDSLNC